MKHTSLFSALLAVTALTACTQNQVDRLKAVGKEPDMMEVGVPVDKHMTPVYWPNRKALDQAPSTANSLWRTEARSFFDDNRASRVGDILTVQVAIQDRAELENTTERTRENTNQLDVGALYGLRDRLTNLVPGVSQGSAGLLDLNGNLDESGEGTIEREERIETQVAAVITQKLPNGNFVIYGSQEIRVNYEVRQLTIQGVVAPDAITPENQVSLFDVAEARVSYGGKGLITDLQQPRVGSQIIDILSPW